MPGRPGHSVQVLPEGAGRISIKISTSSSPSDSQNTLESSPLFDSFRNILQGLFPLPSNDHIDPRIFIQDALVIKRNMRTSPYSHRIWIEAFYFAKNPGSNG
jgi:hypothetical protein